MKYAKAAIFLFFSVLAQVSFLRLVSFLPFYFDPALIVLFILSYRISRIGIFFLAVFAGILLDLFSAAHFGLSIFAAGIAILSGRFMGEKLARGKNFTGIFLSSAAFFIFFYSSLFFGDWILNFSGGNNLIFNLFGSGMAIMIFFNILIAAGCQYFLESGNKYVDI